MARPPPGARSTQRHDTLSGDTFTNAYELEDVDTELNALCSKGIVIQLDPDAAVLTFIPMTCKKWSCKYCAPRLADKLHRRIHYAQPNKFITLTVDPAHIGNPIDAEERIRKTWPKFVAAIRKHRPDFEYLRVLEYQKNGWPHLHLLARCHYIPHKLLANTWHSKVLNGFVSIKAVKNPDTIGQELTKYIRKSFTLNAVFHKNRKAYTTSKRFFQDPSDVQDHPPPQNIITFCTHLELSMVLSYIDGALGILGTIEINTNTLTLKVAASQRASASSLLADYLGTLPWWNKHTNRAAAAKLAAAALGRAPP